MKRVVLASVLLTLFTACPEPKAAAHRVDMQRISGNVLELIPLEGQPEWCLAFTISDRGRVIRQLTMNRKNRSFACPAGKPIANNPFRIPVDEGPVKVYVFFFDRKTDAATIAAQLVDLAPRQAFNVLDLRAAGRMVSERFDFIPEEEPTPTTGELVGAGDTAEDGGSSDAGVKTEQAP